MFDCFGVKEYNQSYFENNQSYFENNQSYWKTIQSYQSYNPMVIEVRKELLLTDFNWIYIHVISKYIIPLKK